MRTIHVLRSARKFFIDGIFWGDDEEGVILYLKAKGVSPDDITKALAGVAQDGGYRIQHAESAWTPEGRHGRRGNQTTLLFAQKAPTVWRLSFISTRLPPVSRPTVLHVRRLMGPTGTIVASR